MVYFGGTYSGKLDDKGRVPFPAPFRKRLEEGDKEQIVCRFNPASNCLQVYTMSVWAEKCNKMYENFDEYEDNDSAHLEDFFKKSYYVDIDSAGRILLNKTLKGFIKAENEVTFSGNGKYIHIYKKEDNDEDQIPNAETENEIKARLKRK